ncbi:MAG: glycerol-3-phosphate dehydrogenase [Ignavibacteria bacterium GWF2_33_9]|nr:MAG: glycerol-3-phosphate dehydrogenase [Ignavibacteria bacterium GWF2_33_9]
MELRDTIPVIGAGGWGTALATVLVDNGYKVILWAREPELVEEINSQHTNSLFLPNAILSENITAENDLSKFADFPFFVSAVPTQFIRSTYSNCGFSLKHKKVLNLAKGIEIGSLDLCSKIFGDLGLPSENFAVLTGPSHAEEVSKSTPTAVVTASEDENYAFFVQKLLSNENFRVYTSHDTVGCEMGGSLKNVIAVAAGIIDGLQIGDNTKAALLTRGLAEITRLSLALGANAMTLSGLAGLGDLFVTCNSMHSRNRKVGELLGQGKKLSEILTMMKTVAEGISTTKSSYELSKKHNVEMPIIEKVHEILFEDLDPKIAIKQLMTRESKHEWWW